MPILKSIEMDPLSPESSGLENFKDLSHSKCSETNHNRITKQLSPFFRILRIIGRCPLTFESNYETGTDLYSSDLELVKIKPGPLHIKLKFTIATGNKKRLRFQGNELLNMDAKDFPPGENEMEILIDKTVAEIFINKGQRYILVQLQPGVNNHSLEFDGENYGPVLQSLDVYEMKSIWNEK